MNEPLPRADRLGRSTVIVWLAFAAALLLAPLLVQLLPRSGLALTTLAQVSIAIVACLSFNLLLGQGGMLSFGHAVYSGLGAYAAIHALRAAGAGLLPIPISLIPLVGGAAGAVTAALLGFIATRHSRSAFAMITLGIGEMVAALALMLPALSGGEAGISANRVVGTPLWGIDFASQAQVCTLLAAYATLCSAAMFAFTRTPLGRMLNAVRDNPERVGFIGVDPRQIRWLAFCIAGGFAGVAGGMFVLNTELVTPEVVGTARSGAYLLFTVLGGTTLFFGPVVGALLMVGGVLWLSALTPAWLLYLGLLFIATVMLAPAGIAGLLTTDARRAALRRLRARFPDSVARMLCVALMLTGVVALIEMAYRRQRDDGLGPVLHLAGLALDTSRASTWLIAAALAGAGSLGVWLVERRSATRGAPR